MDLIQPISRLVAGPVLALKNGRKDLKYVRAVERSQYWPPEQLASWRLDALRQLLVHANRNCPFHARRFTAVGLDPQSVSKLGDIEALPLLTKADIQTHRDAMVATNLPPGERIPNRTGGSTGAPLQFFMSPDSVYRRIANTIRHDRWAGLQPYHKAASIWGQSRDIHVARPAWERLRNALWCRRIVLDASSITEERLQQFIARLRREKPTSYVAYAHAMYLLARYIRERSLTDYHRPKSIICSAEVLTDEQRELIEAVFDCPVFNRYGCREFSVIASECSAHRGLHIAAETLLVEVVRDGRPCRPGELGEIVITDLFNYAMPMIRYAIRDIGILLEGECPCGRTLPQMEIVGGRVTDFLVTPEGAVVSGAAMTIVFIAKIPGVRQAQIVQSARDLLVLRLAIDGSFGDESRRMVAEAVREFFGPNMRHEIEPVDFIPTDASGKYRFSISEIDPLEHLR